MSGGTEDYEGVYKLDNTPIKFVIRKGTTENAPFFCIFRDSDPEILNKLNFVFGGNGINMHNGSYSLFLHINEKSFEKLKSIITTGSSPQSGLISTDPEYNIMNHPGEWMNAEIGGPAITEYENSKTEAKAAEAKAAEAKAAEAAKKKRTWLPFSKTGSGIRRKPTKRRRNRRGNRKTKKI
jgi:hypothetical protein